MNMYDHFLLLQNRKYISVFHTNCEIVGYVMKFVYIVL